MNELGGSLEGENISVYKMEGMKAPDAAEMNYSFS
jgi:hypothetical protein